MKDCEIGYQHFWTAVYQNRRQKIPNAETSPRVFIKTVRCGRYSVWRVNPTPTPPCPHRAPACLLGLPGSGECPPSAWWGAALPRAGAAVPPDKVVSRSQMVATLTALYLQLTQPRLTPGQAAGGPPLPEVRHYFLRQNFEAI